LPIVKFYRSKAALEGSLTVTTDLVTGGVQRYKNTEVRSRMIVSINCISLLNMLIYGMLS
jgi:hypothetical protein